MPTRKRDPSFLYMALMAGGGGVLAIVCSIGMPIWAWHQGKPYNPAFSLFAAWGIAAMLGAYACLRTYLLTDLPKPKPPGGGVRLELVKNSDAVPASSSHREERRVA